MECKIKKINLDRFVNRSQSIYEALSFLTQQEVVNLQQLNKRFYSKVIPYTLPFFLNKNSFMPIYFEDSGVLH
jgi:hypothetical protein